MRCPHCGFFNLTARAKCARCGKSLPEIPAGQKDMFPEDETTGSGSVLPADLISQTGESLKPKEEMKKVSLLEEAEKAEAGEETPVVVRTEEIALLPDAPEKPEMIEAEPLPLPPSPEPAEEFSSYKPVILEEEVAPRPGPASKPTAPVRKKSFFEREFGEGSGSKSGSIIEGEVITQATGISKEAPVPIEYEPELPSFDEAAASKSRPRADLGDLSNFFKGEKKTPEPVQEEPAAEGSELRLNKESEESEESLSRIGIEKEEGNGASFKPDFEEPRFPQFGADSAESSAAESSESAVASPAIPGKSRIVFAGMFDLLIYMGIAALFGLAGQWASGIPFSSLSLSEQVWPFGILILAALSAVVWFYQLFFIAVLGQTLGGMMMKVEILEPSGNRPRILKASLRALIYVLCLIPFGLGFLPTVLSNSLPDLVARTKAVRW